MSAFIRSLCLAALLAAGSTWAQQQQTDQDHEAMMLKNATPEMQLQKLHKVNLHEIEMGKLADQNGTDRVKTFARTLIRDHQDADHHLLALAKKKNISLEGAAMNPDRQKEKEMKKDRLSTLKGTDFDREFANEMAKGHQKVIALAQTWKQNCKDQDVCNLIDSLLPTLQQHLQMAERLRTPAAQGRAPETNR